MRYSDYRAYARQRLQGKWLMAALVTFIASLLGGISTQGAKFALNVEIPQDTQHAFPENLIEQLPWDTLLPLLTSSMIVIIVIGIVLAIIGGVVSLGYRRYTLKICDGQDAQIEDLFSQFKNFGRAFTLNFLIELFTFLWMLLFIIPGIVKAYSYSMAPYIALENPDLSPLECITRSRELMDGHKGELFTLELTFIGWSLLASLTLGIGNLFLQPYVYTTHAVFYRDITRSLPGRTAPVREPQDTEYL